MTKGWRRTKGSRIPEAERFWPKVEFGTQPNDCWIWRASLLVGYGRFRLSEGGNILAHRWSYENLRGSIPEDLELDHLCLNKACVNPDHLEPVTHQENARRAGAAGLMPGSSKTACPQGHLYDEINTYRWRGRRLCRSCRAAVSHRINQTKV